MPRTLRVEYPGTISQIMDRGDRREGILVNDVDRQDVLKTLAEAWEKTGWQAHAYCLMRQRKPPCPSSGLPRACKWGVPRASSLCYTIGYTPARNLPTTAPDAHNFSSNLRFVAESGCRRQDNWLT